MVPLAVMAGEIEPGDEGGPTPEVLERPAAVTPLSVQLAATSGDGAGTSDQPPTDAVLAEALLEEQRAKFSGAGGVAGVAEAAYAAEHGAAAHG
jgi:hypothetical protein